MLVTAKHVHVRLLLLGALTLLSGQTDYRPDGSPLQWENPGELSSL